MKKIISINRKRCCQGKDFISSGSWSLTQNGDQNRIHPLFLTAKCLSLLKCFKKQKPSTTNLNHPSFILYNDHNPKLIFKDISQITQNSMKHIFSVTWRVQRCSSINRSVSLNVVVKALVLRLVPSTRDSSERTTI